MFNKIQKTIPSSYFRANLAKSLRSAKKEPLIVTADRGSDQYIVFGVDLYNKQVQTYEDEVDAAILAKLYAEDPNPKGISFEEMMKGMNRKKKKK